MNEWIRLQYEEAPIGDGGHVQYTPITEQEPDELDPESFEYVPAEQEISEHLTLSAMPDQLDSESQCFFQDMFLDETRERDETRAPNVEEIYEEDQHHQGGATEPVFDADTASSTVRMRMIERTLTEIQKYIETLLVLIRQDMPTDRDGTSQCEFSPSSVSTEERHEDHGMLFGVFNGESFLSPEGELYAVPPNYASKSQLVCGDELKLQILENGKLQYKQIGPVKRRHIRGILEMDPVSGSYSVLCDEGRFRVLNASVSFFKGMPGDSALLIIPQSGFSQWGAIEKIEKHTQDTTHAGARSAQP